MENPFELIIDKLNNIENLLKTVMKKDNGTVTITEVLNLNQAAEYVSLSKSAIYKKLLKEIFHTSNRVRNCILNVVN